MINADQYHRMRDGHKKYLLYSFIYFSSKGLVSLTSLRFISIIDNMKNIMLTIAVYMFIIIWFVMFIVYCLKISFFMMCFY